MNNRIKGRKSPVAVTAGVLSLAAVLYGLSRTSFVRSLLGSEDKVAEKPKAKRYTKKSVAIVMTESVLEADIPVMEILSHVPFGVLVLPPGVEADRLNLQCNEAVSESDDCEDNSLQDCLYKIISCDTEIGVAHVIKHLGCDLVFLADDSLIEIPSEIQRE